jgi:hypothetical protein
MLLLLGVRTHKILIREIAHYVKWTVSLARSAKRAKQCLFRETMINAARFANSITSNIIHIVYLTEKCMRLPY